MQTLKCYQGGAMGSQGEGVLTAWYMLQILMIADNNSYSYTYNLPNMLHFLVL